jgi:ribosomal protein S18 acetylase RimI-like enzyme
VTHAHATEIVIRLATHADAQAYATLRCEALTQNPEAFSSDPQTDGLCTSLGVVERLANPDALMLVACDGAQLVGMATLIREKKPKLRHRADIVGVYVRPPHRGRGVAWRMMQDLEARARLLDGLLVLNLAVTRTQVQAVRLYQSLGYHAWGIEPMGIRIDDRCMEGVFMQKRLVRD